MAEEKTIEGQKVELTPFEAGMLRDFYHSFRHSQGNVELQNLIILYTARHYDYKDFGDISKMSNKLDIYITEMDIPKEHIDKVKNPQTEQFEPLDYQKAQVFDAGFQNMWKRQLLTLKRIFMNEPTRNLFGFDLDLYENSRLPMNKLVSEITLRIMFNDNKYQVIRRPNRKESHDSHMSFYNTYAVDGKSTGSQAYDQLYKDIKELCDNLGIGEVTSSRELVKRGLEIGLSDEEVLKLNGVYIELKGRWESRHEGQKFASK